MDTKLCVFVLTLAVSGVARSGETAESHELRDKSEEDSGPYQSVYNMDFMKGGWHYCWQKQAFIKAKKQILILMSKFLKLQGERPVMYCSQNFRTAHVVLLFVPDS